MATLSSYPRSRGGSVVLRLFPDEIDHVNREKKDDFFRNNVFRIQGAIDPFRVKVIPVEHGVQFHNAGAGRLAVNLKPGSLELLQQGDDIVWEGLSVIVASGRVFVVEGVNTRTRLSRTRKKGRRTTAGHTPILQRPLIITPDIIAPMFTRDVQTERAEPPTPPSSVPTTRQRRAEPTSPGELRIDTPRPLRSTYLRDRRQAPPQPPPTPQPQPRPAAPSEKSDLRQLMRDINRLLETYDVKLIETEITNGRISRIRVKRPKAGK